MKNRKARHKDEFEQFKIKMFLRTVLMTILAVWGVFVIHSFLQGKFANWVVYDIFMKLLRMDERAALNLYTQVVRNRLSLIFIAAMLVLFFVIFRIYLNWYTKYFMEINKGIDALIRDGAGEVSLPPELFSIEKKINTIQHTLEKQRLDAELAEQRKNDLIVYLAHDLKTPLASVMGYLNLLHDEKQISEELRGKYLSISLNKAERLEELINEFFEIAKFNLSNITLQYGTINLTLLLEQLICEFAPMLKEKDLHCNLSIAENVMLSCDADKLQRVFDNLLRNAVIYSLPHTEIAITVVTEKDSLVIRFANHGNTIPKEKLERIFEQFYRLDAARSTNSGGAGLGLAIARQIVRLHNGTITAKSEDGLTEFVVAIPAS